MLDENKKYYESKFNMLFSILNLNAALTIARFSYLTNDLKLFSPIYVGNNNNFRKSTEKYFNNSYKEAIKNFSFSKLISENNNAVFFKFEKDNKNKIEVKENSNDSSYQFDIYIKKIDDNLINNLKQKFKKIKLNRYDNIDIESLNNSYIESTLTQAVNRLLDSKTIKCIYFVPIVIPLAINKICGILSINSEKKIEKEHIVGLIKSYIGGVISPFHIYEFKFLLDKNYLKSSIISILVDSYAHNISAHSLVALKWWFEKRVNNYDKRINIGDTNKKNIINSLENLKPSKICNKDLIECAKKSDIYYKILGSGDITNNFNYTSLLEIVKLIDPKMEKSLLSYEAKDREDESIDLYRYPVPIDHGISKFIRFLRDKAAFWSGVTRDLPFGGEVKNLYDVLWNDFADNPLYLGTIAHSEGINKLNIGIELPCAGINGSDFARIDMSVIDFEDKLYSDKYAGIIPIDRQALEYNGLENETDENRISFSKYSMVHPGKDHKNIREELQKNDYNVFFPGGVVGKHALFTIFENTIRNVKHLNITDDIKKEGLNFNIKIFPAKLIDQGQPSLGDHEHKLFKIEVYLNHDNMLFELKKKKEKSEIKRIKHILEEETEKPVSIEGGSPRLGGNAQDKICAAMLLNNTFMSVEPYVKPDITERDNYYYNTTKKFFWIGFKDTLTNEELEKLNNYTRQADVGFEDVQNKLKNNKGKLLKYFHLWKGDFIYPVSSFENLHNENISRFKIIYINDDEIKNQEQLLIELKKKGIIRILNKIDFDEISQDINVFKNVINVTNIEELSNKIIKMNELNSAEKYLIYLAWLKKFIDKEKIFFYKCSEKPEPKMIISDYKYKSIGTCSRKSKKIYFRHSGDTYGIDPYKILDYRSHGWMRDKIFCNDNFGFYTDDKDNDIIYDIVFDEFVEVLSTKICIIDKRVNNRIKNINKKKYSSLLNLNIYGEFNIENAKEKKEWEELKENILLSCYNFLIIHLSFIESLGIREEKINNFFEDELKFNENNIPDKFNVIITTGRGRSRWIKFLDPAYKKITMFKPIESILDAVEHALTFKDDIQLKYNLSKLIYGS